MKEMWWVRNLYFIFVAIGLVLVFSSCVEGTPGPEAWIDFPREGSLVELGESQTVISHAFAAQGIAEAVLYVNGEALSKSSPPDPVTNFSEMNYEWIPRSEGLQTLQVVAYASTGEEIRSAPLTVNVIGDKPTATASTVISTTLDTPMVTFLAVETQVSTTTVVDTPTPTETPNPLIQFWAEPSTLTAGECTAIR